MAGLHSLYVRYEEAEKLHDRAVANLNAAVKSRRWSVVSVAEAAVASARRTMESLYYELKGA